jgi:hypothetical protein
MLYAPERGIPPSKYGHNHEQEETKKKKKKKKKTRMKIILFRNKSPYNPTK